MTTLVTMTRDGAIVTSSNMYMDCNKECGSGTKYSNGRIQKYKAMKRNIRLLLMDMAETAMSINKKNLSLRPTQFKCSLPGDDNDKGQHKPNLQPEGISQHAQRLQSCSSIRQIRLAASCCH